MPRVLSYLLIILAGALGGLYVGAYMVALGGTGLGLLVLYALSLAGFLIAIDALLLDTGVRAIVGNAEVVRKHVLLLGAAVAACTGITLAVILAGAQLIFRVFPSLRAIVYTGTDEVLLTSGPAVLIPVAVFAAIVLVLTAIEFFGAGSDWWQRARPSIAQARGRIGLLLLAGFIDAAALTVVSGQWKYLSLGLVGVLLVSLLALADVLLANSRIWGVARHMIAEGIRMKVAVVFIVIILLLLAVLPFTVAGDGLTLKSRVQNFLAYSLGPVGFFLSLLTVFLACATLSNEIRTRQIFMVASKPIPRWQFFAGKWLGISLLNAGLLALSGLSVLGFTWYLESRPTNIADDKAALEQEVLKVRHGVFAQEPSNLLAQVDDRIRFLREEGRLEDAGPGGEAALRTQLTEELRRSWRSIPPRDFREYTFENLMVDREADDFLHLYLKPTSPSGVDDVVFRIVWRAGDPDDLNTLTPERYRELLTERQDYLVVPVSAVSKAGTLHVFIHNTNPRDTMVFEDKQSIELMYGIGTFHWNLFRALSVIWCRLAFLAALGLLASSFLSFPVACMACLLVLMVATGANFLHESIEAAEPKGINDDPLWILGPILRPIAVAFVWLVPDFSKYDPVGNVVGGRLVPLMWLLVSIRDLLIIQGLIIAAAGCVILTKRELAQVTT
jgi:hypothetical protein